MLTLSTCPNVVHRAHLGVFFRTILSDSSLVSKTLLPKFFSQCLEFTKTFLVCFSHHLFIICCAKCVHSLTAQITL